MNKKDKNEMTTYTEMISANIAQPRIDAATPRTADDTMCVMGEVILMESKLAMLIKNPKIPCTDRKMEMVLITETEK